MIVTAMYAFEISKVSSVFKKVLTHYLVIVDKYLPTISKKIEIIICNQPLDYVNESNLLTKQQHGIWPHLSTYTCMSIFRKLSIPLRY